MGPISIQSPQQGLGTTVSGILEHNSGRGYTLTEATLPWTWQVRKPSSRTQMASNSSFSVLFSVAGVVPPLRFGFLVTASRIPSVYSFLVSVSLPVTFCASESLSRRHMFLSPMFICLGVGTRTLLSKWSRVGDRTSPSVEFFMAGVRFFCQPPHWCLVRVCPPFNYRHCSGSSNYPHVTKK